MNREAKNAVITLSNLNNTRAEVFWHTVNCQKIAEHYRQDLSKQGTKGQFHDLLFADIVKALKGNVYVELVPKSSRKYKAISYYKQHYYQTFFYLKKREDCDNTKFLVIVSIYRTYHQADHEKFNEYEKVVKEKFNSEKPPDK